MSIGITQTFNSIIFPIVLLMLIYLISILVLRPYKSCFSNISIITNEVLSILFICLALVNKYFKIDSDTEIFAILVLEGLIIICFAFSLIRILIHVCSLCKKEEFS